MQLEGVLYFRYVIRFTQVGGKRRRLVRWAPLGFIDESFHRELGWTVKPGSNVYITHEAL